MLKYTLLSICLMMLYSCEDTKLHKYSSSNEALKYSGRHEVLTDTTTALIGSAASVEFNVMGDSINIYLQTESSTRNYYVITVNDEYTGRSKIEGDAVQKIALKLPNTEQNKVGIYKATEAFNDKIILHSIDAKAILPLKEKPFSIEFIGNSVTCGALSDDSDIVCNEGDYQDQHNAYLAYGPKLARRLNAEVVLSSVSGIGMYRNWNDENREEPIMPQIYDRLYLSMENPKPYNLDVKPDIVSICLGTNDMSYGDGEKERLPFNSEKYTNNYIQFVETLYKRYPDTTIALLSSPMIDGPKQDTLFSCLKKVQTYFNTNQKKDLALFQFDKVYTNGCNYHPSVEDHQEMAIALEPFFKSLLNKG